MAAIDIQAATDDATVWGYFAPKGLARALLLVQQCGFARGSVKKHLGKLWQRMSLPTPVDMRYAGLKFRLHPFDNTVEYKMLFGSKPRDEQEMKTLRSAVANGGVFLDIGANIGYYALMAAHFGASRVLAFEPNPLVSSRLGFNIAANGLEHQVQAMNIALGVQTSMMTMLVSDRDMGGSSIAQDGEVSGNAITVQVEPLDNVLRQEGIERINALKIDVEGMEDRVLMPFFETRDKRLWPLVVIIEHTSKSQWKSDVLAWMLQAGYRETGRNRSNAMLELIDEHL